MHSTKRLSFESTYESTLHINSIILHENSNYAWRSQKFYEISNHFYHLFTAVPLNQVIISCGYFIL